MKMKDRVLFIGRGVDYMNYTKATFPTAKQVKEVFNSASDYMSYLAEFNSETIIVHSQDFQDFLGYIDECYPTVRHRGRSQYKHFNEDVFVVKGNQFVKQYLKKYAFDDMYVYGYYIDSNPPDYIFSIDSEPIVKASQPSNVKKITSVNGKDWLPDSSIYQPTLVTSQLLSQDLIDPYTDQTTNGQEAALHVQLFEPASNRQANR